MTIVASGAYRQDRRIVTVDGKNKFEIEAVVTNGGDFPDAYWFLFKIVDSANASLDTYERVAVIEDFFTYKIDRAAAVLAGDAFYRKANAKVLFDDVGTSVAAIQVWHDLINKQALTVATSKQLFFPNKIAEQFNVPVEETTLASGTTGTSGADNQIQWTAATPGTAGNRVRVLLKDPGAISQSLSITVAQYTQTHPYNSAAVEVLQDVEVRLATNGAGTITSKKRDVIGAVNAHATAGKIVQGFPLTATEGAIVAGETKQLSGGNRGDRADQAIVDAYTVAKTAREAQEVTVETAKTALTAANKTLTASQTALTDIETLLTSVTNLKDIIWDSFYDNLISKLTDSHSKLTEVVDSLITNIGTVNTIISLLPSVDPATAKTMAQTVSSSLTNLKNSVTSVRDAVTPVQLSATQTQTTNESVGTTSLTSATAIAVTHRGEVTTNRNTVVNSNIALSTASDQLITQQTVEAEKLADVRTIDPDFDPATAS